MQRRTMMLSVSTLTLLVGLTACDKTKPIPPTIIIRPTLIEIPSDLRKCAETSGVKIPDGPLTVAQVERLWKEDRVRIAILRNCARRALEFYSAQKKRLDAK